MLNFGFWEWVLFTCFALLTLPTLFVSGTNWWKLCFEVAWRTRSKRPWSTVQPAVTHHHWCKKIAIWKQNKQSIWKQNKQSIWKQNKQSIWKQNKQSIWKQNKQSNLKTKSPTTRLLLWSLLSPVEKIMASWIRHTLRRLVPLNATHAQHHRPKLKHSVQNEVTRPQQWPDFTKLEFLLSAKDN